MNCIVLSFLVASTLIAWSHADAGSSGPAQNMCNRQDFESINTQCINCRANLRARCPTTFRKTSRGIGKRGCRYRKKGRPARGCYHKCIKSIQVQECCSGYWGQDCQRCPSGRHNIVCSGRGLCSDLKTGNGSCACRGNVAGSACETCASDDQYGASCLQTCACVHGLCDSGVDRPGTCSCESGYGGALCDTVLSECAKMNCHVNSRCLNSTGSLMCQCYPGYEGNGTNCTPINPCQDTGSNLCHTFATCQHTGPAKYSCRCQAGYSGDGFWCGPIDPCQTNNGGCPGNTTVCKYTGPGRNTCPCKTGYNATSTSTSGSGCTLIDICGLNRNTTCDSIAQCTTVDDGGIIQAKCTCPPTFLTRGMRCYSDLFTEMLLTNSSGPFANRLNKAVAMFQSTYFRDIFYGSTPFTIIAPLDGAFGSELGQPNSSVAWKAVARAHIVATTIDVDFSTQSAKTMYPLLGYQTSIKALKPLSADDDDADDGDAGTFALLNFANSYRTGKLLVAAQWAANGVFYVSNALLQPPDTFPIKDFDASSMSLLSAIQSLPMASSFLKWLKSNFLTLSWVTASDSNFTIFVPTNDAIAKLSVDERKALINQANRNKLDILLRHHVSMSLVKSSSLSGMTELQMYSEAIPVNVSMTNGIFYLGSNYAKILWSEIPVANGKVLLYLIDQVLMPSFVRPLVDNKCEQVTQSTRQGACQVCNTRNPTCADGAVYTSRQLCALEVETISGSVSPDLGQRLGCRAVCSVNVTSSICCPGYFGVSCQSCPGPVGSPCNGNGNCDDGLNGLGTCSCRSGFTGDDCSVCANPTSYGTRCYLNCTCAHGRCDNRIDSRGICVPGSCNQSWAGEDCDRHVTPCGPGGIICHQNAVCILTENVESCICEAGYTGNGRDCVEFNPCVDADDRGGCDRNAICQHYGKGHTSCVCKENFNGDGRSCIAVNPCNQANRGGCHSDANCIFTGPGASSCECKAGYRGSGLVCNGIDNCLQNNGGCHTRATCKKTGPGTNDCKCMDGYSGDGRQCVGTLMMEIAEHPELSLINHWIGQMPAVQAIFTSIRHDHVTAFLPRNDAWNAMSQNDFQFWANEQHLPALLQHHIVPREIPSYLLKKETSLNTLLPLTNILVTNITSGVAQQVVGDNTTMRYEIPTLGRVHSKIVVPDLRIFNGLVEIIDQVLLPPRDTVGTYPTLAQAVQNSTGTDLQPFSVFIRALNDSGIISQLDATNQSYTIFALSNDLYNPADFVLNTKEVLQYHVVPGKMLRSKYVDSGQHDATLLGPGYQVSLTRSHGNLFVNRQQISRSDVRTARGIIQGYDGDTLMPVKSRCDVKRSTIFATACIPCSSSANQCKEDKLARIFCTLPPQTLWRYPLSTVGNSGCRHLCREKTVSAQCCAGFYGTDCEPCPGGVNNVCFKRGNCSDGIRGKGTCKCTDAKYAGDACDDCAPGRFGDDCSSQCACVNGTCNDGRKGNGACVCAADFTGPQCDQPYDPNDACGGTCHTSSWCSKGPFGSKCVCATGYSGDGSDCQPTNPCDSSGTPKCHRYASCIHRGPGQYQCKCKPDYRGDGNFCAEINPCVNFNETECDQQNADCHHTGPNQSHCSCRSGYTGDGKTCSPVDACLTDNGGCHRFAMCKKSGPGTRDCTCLPSYVGDGVVTCIGTIYQELRSDSATSWIFASQFMRRILGSPGPMTLFLPNITDSASMKLNFTDFYLKHVVGCGSFNATLLGRETSLQSLEGSTINVSMSNGNIFVNGNKRVYGGQAFSNGYVLRITDTIVPLNIATLSPTPKPADIFESLNLNKFASLLSRTALSQTILDTQLRQGQWTLFLPTDEAFDQLSSYKKRQLATDPEVAKEYARYHMVRQSFLTPADVISFQELTTMQGSDVAIGCSPDAKGSFILNGGEAKAIRFLSKSLAPESPPSALYLIDKVLQPPSVGGRCDVVSNVTTMGTCSFCGERGMGCPSGSTKVGEQSATCTGQITGVTTSFEGCKAKCVSYKVIKKCCDDYYAKDCHPCPGGVDNACNHNGVCDQGINGTGKCTCNKGFKGYACELCKTGRYGFTCAECKCSVHGTCSEGLNGDGSCFCDEGYTGDACDKKLVHPANCTTPCVENAVCVEGGVCICRPEYRGFGTVSCDVPDLCGEKPNGGCSPHARCRQVDNKRVTCTCLPTYTGDGFVCEGTDPCQGVTNPPKCHASARCVYAGPNVTRCECLPGYSGDGVRQCDPTSGLPRSCAVENGGCHRMAVCQSEQFPLQGVKCSCKKGYVGDGVICNGNIFQVLSEGKYDMGKFFLKLIRSKTYMPQILSNNFNITLFVPVDSAISFRKLKYKVLKRHMVTGKILTTSELQKVKAIRVDSRDPLPVQTFPDGSIYINGVRMRRADIVATNGIIHTMEKVIPAGISKIVSSTTSVSNSPAPGSSSTSTPKPPTQSPQSGKPPIDGGGLPVNSTPGPNATQSTLGPKTSVGPPKRTPAKAASSGNGVKVGIAVGIVLILLLAVIAIYWKKRSSAFVFHPLSERAGLTSRSTEDAFDDPPRGFGVMNPAYDSTGFSEHYESVAPDATAAPPASIASPIEAAEAEEEALIALDDIGD